MLGVRSVGPDLRMAGRGAAVRAMGARRVCDPRVRSLGTRAVGRKSVIVRQLLVPPHVGASARIT